MPPHYYHHLVILDENGTAASVDPTVPASSDSPLTSELSSEPTSEATTDLGSTSEPDGGGDGNDGDGDENVWLIAGPVIAVAVVVLLVAAIVGAFLFYRYCRCVLRLTKDGGS